MAAQFFGFARNAGSHFSNGVINRVMSIGSATVASNSTSGLEARVVETSLRTLPRMIVPGTRSFCLQLARDNSRPEFAPIYSPRYSIMCLLGLERARRAGLVSSLDLDSLFDAAVRSLPELTVGDVGLLLWFAARRESAQADMIAKALEQKLAQTDLDRLQGMEIGWLITGTAFYEAFASMRAFDAGRRLVEYFFQKRISPSGLAWHLGHGWRRRFPNFATQIYSVHALSIRARLHKDERCGEQAIAIASKLKALQRENGGWPWLYDAMRGIVVEPFEVYSVHQHAMGPMGLLELNEATGFDVRDMLRRSMSWLERNNELQFPMIDENTGLIYRSIRRRPPRDRFAIYSRVARSFAGLRVDDGHCENIPGLEMNLTCRPYELGWALEAWTGRDNF
jgi:hypothetical protein